MVEWSLEKEVSGLWREYTLMRDGKPVASARWRRHGNDAELHNEIFSRGRDVLVRVIQSLDTIREDMRAEGIGKIVAMCDHCTPTIKHYWHMMGFRFFGTYNDGTHTAEYAVMEA
jgi:transposase InsO family protein